MRPGRSRIGRSRWGRGSSFLLSIDDFALATVATRPDRREDHHLKFYELRDNLFE